MLKIKFETMGRVSNFTKEMTLMLKTLLLFLFNIWKKFTSSKPKQKVIKIVNF
jgi:hypothetical protein